MNAERTATEQPTPRTGSGHQADEVFQALMTPQRVPATGEEQALLAGAVSLRVRHGDNRLAVWQWGHEGPRVLLVHGWNSRASHLGHYIQTLLAAGYQVLAFDGTGHGESEGGRSNVVDLGQAVLRVVETAGPVEAAIGHSMGSPALLYAFAHGLEVRASIHVAGPSSLRGVLYRTAAMAGLDTEQRDRLITLMEAETGMSVEEMELTRLAQGFRHPALIVHDADDREVPVQESQQLHAAWTGATLHVVSGLGHRRVISDRAVIELGLELLGRYLPISRTVAEEVGS
ncbi:alpha/beta fold hydrolase [Marinobacter sp. LN3S78]|uniref:alpha/beta fold hydrolase n=1 Tax=Marinobacter sp. LN3S78 TaxID=3382300 RepID=UPI00387AFEAB